MAEPRQIEQDEQADAQLFGRDEMVLGRLGRHGAGGDGGNAQFSAGRQEVYAPEKSGARFMASFCPFSESAPMHLDATGWIVTAVAILLTGISKSGLWWRPGRAGGAFMSLWMSPRDAVAVMLPVLIAMDLFGIRAWRGKADWAELRLLLPASLVGIALGTLAFGVMSDRMVKGAVG